MYKNIILAFLIVTFSISVLAHGTPPVGTPSGKIDGIDIPYNPIFPSAFYPYVRIDGCSSASGLPSETVPDSSIIHAFHPACDNHDRCWGEPGNSGVVCDKNFYSDMIDLCIEKFVDEAHVNDVLGVLGAFGGLADDLFDEVLDASPLVISLSSTTTYGERISSIGSSGIQPRGFGLPSIIVAVFVPGGGAALLADEVLNDGGISDTVDSSVSTATKAVINEMKDAGVTVYKFLDEYGNEVACWSLAPGLCLTSTVIDELTGYNLWDEFVLELGRFLISPGTFAACTQLAGVYAKVVRANDILNGAVSAYQVETKEYREYAKNHVNAVKLVPIITNLLLN